MFKLLIKTLSIFSIFLVLMAEVIPLPFGGYADQRFWLVLLFPVLISGGVLTLFFCAGKSSKGFLSIAWPTLLLVISFLLLSANFWDQPYVWVEPGMYAFYFFTTLLAASALSRVGGSVDYSVFLVYSIVIGCLFYAGMTINIYLFALFDGVGSLVNYIPWGFVNIRYWSHVATWALPLLPLGLLIGPYKYSKIWRSVVILTAGLWWWVVFLSAARGSSLGILFGSTLAGLLVGKRALPWLKMSILCLFVGVGVWLLLSVVFPSILLEGVQVRPVSSGDSGRFPLFYEAWQMSLQSFPFGMGPQSWLTHDILTDGYAASPKLGHPHNMYLMWAAEYGWALIVSLSVVVGQAVRAFFRCKEELIRNDYSWELLLLAGFVASVSAALFHAGVSAVFIAPGSMLVGLFVLIAFWSLVLSQSNSKKSEVVKLSLYRRFYSFLAVVVIFSILILWLIWSREVWVYYKDMRADEMVYQEQGGDRMLPRFWFHGNFPRR